MVRQDKIDPVKIEQIQGLLTRTCGQHPVACPFKHELSDSQLILFVIYTQDGVAH
jgi:hypothetical protein